MLNKDQMIREGLLTFDDVEQRLVEATQMLWRTEGGYWPFASDGPWHLITKEWGDWDARDPKPLRPGPLTRDEVATMEEALGWMLIVRDADRRLVVLAVRRLAAGAKQVPWRELLAAMGLERGADGLRMRYSRAITRIANRLNAGAVRPLT